MGLCPVPSQTPAKPYWDDVLNSGYSVVPLASLECAAAAAAAEGPRRAVPSCAGAYVAGAAGSNECPAGSARIETEDACRNAVILTGKYANPSFVQTNEFAPRGCYYTTVLNTAYFNNHSVGAGYSGAQPLCAAAAAGAPFAPLSAWARHYLTKY